MVAADFASARERCRAPGGFADAGEFAQDEDHAGGHAHIVVEPVAVDGDFCGARSPRSKNPANGAMMIFRLRDKDHRKFVLRQACLVCGRVPSDAHHLTFTQPRALGHRVSDEFIVPVFRVHHRELHRSGDEVTLWRRLNIDPPPVALRLWQHTRTDVELGQQKI
jgi:hypothetical protein